MLGSENIKISFDISLSLITMVIRTGLSLAYAQ